MWGYRSTAAGALVTLVGTVPAVLRGQEPDTAQVHEAVPPAHVEAVRHAVPHRMWMGPIGGGWVAVGMGQVFPLVTAGAPFTEESALRRTRGYGANPVAMVNLEDHESTLVVRLTPNFEFLTLRGGELTPGAWGEEFIDKRHPHTFPHEIMLSMNFWGVAGGGASVSVGRGFAPYGTDDPMARPAAKYPTNHHLSQILERWTVNGVLLTVEGWGFEAGLFSGEEPLHPFDVSNLQAFGRSWSLRVSRRLGVGLGPFAPWELSASAASVREVLDAGVERTTLYNVAVRHAREYGFGELYGMAEFSRSSPRLADGLFSVLAETQLRAGRHRPYYRIELATRPEWQREGLPRTDGFFRYDHDELPIGATRWLINTLGYGFTLTDFPGSIRPFVEVQHHRVREERGGIRPEDLFATGSFWSLSAGARIFLGGEPMRMGMYGVLDPMTLMHRQMVDPAVVLDGAAAR